MTPLDFRHLPRTRPADRNPFLNRIRARWTDTLDCLTRRTNPDHGRDPARRGPADEQSRHAAQRSAGPAETVLRAAVKRAERALLDEDGYSVAETHDVALDLAQAARALLNEVETRHTK